jgi:hypothetical protein
VDTHQKLTSGLNQCNQAIDLMDRWFESRGSGLQQMTAILVMSCMNQVQVAEDELRALVEQN